MSEPYVRSKGSDGTESTTGIRRSGRISSNAHSPDCGSAYGGPDMRRLVGLCSYHRGMKLLRFRRPSLRRRFARRWPLTCLLYTSDAADDLTRVDLGGRRII